MYQFDRKEYEKHCRRGSAFCVEHFIQEVPLNNSNQMFRPAVYPAGRDS